MTKQTFTIPEGCKAVTVEQVGNQIITTFEPEFKRGDVLIAKNSYGESYSILKNIENKIYYYFVACFILNCDESENSLEFDSYMNHQETVKSLRHATPEEAQLLWDALAKNGKRWNPEMMQVEPIKKERWRAEKYEVYYCPIDFEGANCPTQDNRSIIDDYMFDNGFYCQTPDQSERLFKAIKQVTDKFCEEELR